MYRYKAILTFCIHIIMHTFHDMMSCMHAVTCSYPLLHRPVVVSGSQDSPPIEGQFITYTCLTGFILTGPSMSTCMGNREWEPDPGQAACIGNYNNIVIILCNLFGAH